jgi:hypothetical protein
MDRHPFTDEVEAGSAETLLASTLYLMSRHAATPCPKLARVVDRHLAALAAHPGCGPLVRETCRRAAGDWAAARADCPLGFGQPPCEGPG